MVSRGDETKGYEATRTYTENAVAAVRTVVRLQDGGCMAGMKGKSGPPGNMNAFKHGLGGHSETPSRTLNICSAW
jgi:hypothetical protein